MSDYIPNEVLVEILARLPVNSLIRFTLVCKSWFHLITSPSFITKHLNHSKTIRDKVFLRLYNADEREEQYILCRDDEKLGYDDSKLKFPFELVSPYNWIIGSCNGLICICDDCYNHSHHIVIWNPSIRKSVVLPRIYKPQSPYRIVLGFGAHPTTHEYMAVMVVYKNALLNPEREPAKVEIYEQGTGSWRCVRSASFPCFMLEFLLQQAFVNGAVHWVAHDPVTGLRNVVVSFDMGAETFSEMMLPPDVRDQMRVLITSFDESLAVLCGGEMGINSCCVWVMKEYGVAESWTRLFSINLTGILSNITGKLDNVLGFRKNGELLLSTSKERLLSYDPKAQTMTDTGIRGRHPLCIDTFIETLVLVNGRDDVFEGQLNPL
ncbi:F-box protein At3g07870-like [Actinidia eriantha]|uniref:F-box protein At3g07870-like n=1 Tax=Actinidia eriantha TaxID=165200 RepID=UPI002587D8E1|nr:F-box protein At3g07870-like [Actinidia eriantha]XP_057509861.1 F-box protein At3g07870-like [Actinidia eriantha]XP_057509862.1 F-box protein At3g07870-like [Actinidia eriantha]XP_057509863.1 F-box protein At3g07870-like [Actinidia eriantha]XP_057509864.1 F-box protein At3g07870-like [Actinidia eriantha]